MGHRFSTEVSALALDRQAIEKKDFPISRRGYEPEAVDVHLGALAGEVDRLQREVDRAQRAAATAGAPAAPKGVQSLAAVASEQVRMIVEAAESSAAEIERTAQEEAARIRADADTEARRTRDEAVERSHDHVGNVSEATLAMLQRVDAMENELGALLESLRTGTNRLTADLSLLQGNLGDLYGAAGSIQVPAPPRARPAPPAPDEPPAPAAPLDETPEDSPPAGATVVASRPAAAPEAEQPPVPEPGGEAPAAPAERREGGGDVEGARLIALNMALNGQSREETDAYLRENFDLNDRSSLLDEVYATVEG